MPSGADRRGANRVHATPRGVCRGYSYQITFDAREWLYETNGRSRESERSGERSARATSFSNLSTERWCKEPGSRFSVVAFSRESASQRGDPSQGLTESRGIWHTS